MRDRISTKLIQKCQQGDKEFSLPWFMKLLRDNITREEFNMFCREIMILNEYYDSTVGLHCTDRADKVIDTGDFLFELTEADFNRPITLKKIK